MSDWLDQNASGESHDAVGFPVIGDSVVGTVIDLPKAVPTKFGERLVINVQPTVLVQDGAAVTDLTSPRTIWVKPGAMATALRSALAGRKLAVGDTVGMSFTSEVPSKTPGYNPAKQYAAVHEPAAPSADVGAINGQAS